MSNEDYKPGAQIGAYVLDSYIGGGSFGAVWRGHAAATGQAVAIKLLTGQLANSDTSAMRADVELLAAAAASRSAHVVKVLGGGVEPVPYVVMELIEGSDLLGLLAAEGRLTAERTLAVGLALADALIALNQVGIVHRDIKPANVMIDNDGVIKLADFGIAKIAGYSTATMTGQTAMTMAYAAPEIWDEGSSFGRPSHRSDLYAMGVLLYQCLAGTPPFSGNYGALYKAHTERQPDINLLRQETPPSLRILISRCLEKRQDDRPRDAGDCLAMVQRAQAELADASGALVNEPRKLGPWLKDAPHQSVPWAWRCHHERTGEGATVEVHFAGSIDEGARVAHAVTTNPALTALGAERLIDSNRLLLYPGESWQAAPAGEFQFWLAREDLPKVAASSINEAALRSAVASIVGLLEAAAGQGLALDLGHDNLIVADGGAIYLRRPGIATPDDSPEASAMVALNTLPLDERARGMLAGAGSFGALTALLGTSDDATVVIGGSDATQLVARPAPDAATPIVPAAAPAMPEVAPALERAASPLPRQTPVAIAGGGKRAGPAVTAIAAVLGAIAAVAIAAVLVTGGDDRDDYQGQPLAAGSAIAAPTETAVPRAAIPPVAASATSAPPLAAAPTTAPPAPALPSRAEVLAAVEKSNQVYIAAYRSGDINSLRTVFSGAALAYYDADMRRMLNANQRHEHALLQSDVQDVRVVDATHANVRTRERWSYKVVGSTAAPIITTYDEYYELIKTGPNWLVDVNTFVKVP